MELPLVRQEVTSRLAAAACAAALLAAGCVGLKPHALHGHHAPVGDPFQLAATWNPEVMFAPDPAQGGKMSAGLAGRLYLFGSDIKDSMAGDGALSVSLFDDRPLAEGKPAVHLEEWQIDKDTLKRLLRKDAIGWGYTLVLPWGTYRPDLTQVHLRFRYDATKGLPLYTETATLTLNHGPVAHPQTIHRVGKPQQTSIRDRPLGGGRG
jgi:hypothetical protein